VRFFKNVSLTFIILRLLFVAMAIRGQCGLRPGSPCVRVHTSVIRGYFPASVFSGFLSVGKCKNRNKRWHFPEGFFSQDFCPREMCASVCLSVSTCVRVSVRVCDTGYFLHVFPGVFFVDKCNKGTMGRGLFFLMVFPRGFCPKKSAITAL